MRSGEINCPYFHDHTPEPVDESDYLGLHAWARKMGRTHKQIKCKGCDRYAIWAPRARRLSHSNGGARGNMIDWQPGNTAPRDTSIFAVETVLGDIQSWTYDQEKRWFVILHIPGGGQTIAYTNSTIKRWARWNQVFDLIRATPERF